MTEEFENEKTGERDIQLRNQLNEKYNDEVKRVWNIMKDYI